MAVPKDKVLLKLNEVLGKGSSATKNFKDSIATKWAAKIEDEEGIDAFVEDHKDFVLEAVKEGDRRSTAAVKEANAAAAKVITGEGEKPKEIEIPSDIPEWAKALMAQNKALEDSLKGIQSAKQAETIEQRFRSDVRLKGVPEFLLKKAIPTKEEDIENVIAEVAKDWSEFATQNKLASFGNDNPTSVGKSQTKDVNDKPDEAVIAFAKAQNEKFLSQQSKN